MTQQLANQSLSAWSKIACDRTEHPDAGELCRQRWSLSSVCVCFSSAVIVCRVNTALQQRAVNQSRAFIAKQLQPECHYEPHRLSIRCPCHLKVQHAAAGRPRHSSCLWDVTTGPPRKGAGGCQGSGSTGGGGDRCPTEPTGGSRASPEPVGAVWVRAQSRRGGAAPSCRTPPPHRMGERQEVHPPSGPAGLRSDGCVIDRGRGGT